MNFYQGNGVTYAGLLSAVGAVAPNTWQHVVVTRTASSNTIRFYVNGVAKGSGTSEVAPGAGSKPVAIDRSAAGIQYVNGRLDEVALYGVALSPAQVTTHYARRLASGSGTTVALQLVASDSDGDALTYGAAGLPPGLTLDPATGFISGTLTVASAGTHSVTVTASDASATSTQTFTWTVTHVN